MNNLAAIVGYVVIGAIALGAIAVLIVLIVQQIERLLNLRYEDAQRSAMLRMSARFVQDSYWFSEDEPTMKLLQQLANDMTTHGWSDVGPLREKWRRWKSASVNQNDKVS